MDYLLTWSSLNWSPPNAETHGLIPPVPTAITTNPTAARALERREGGREGGEEGGRERGWGGRE